jgi:hypothetical protein
MWGLGTPRCDISPLALRAARGSARRCCGGRRRRGGGGLAVGAAQAVARRSRSVVGTGRGPGPGGELERSSRSPALVAFPRRRGHPRARLACGATRGVAPRRAVVVVALEATGRAAGAGAGAAARPLSAWSAGWRRAGGGGCCGACRWRTCGSRACAVGRLRVPAPRRLPQAALGPGRALTLALVTPQILLARSWCGLRLPGPIILPAGAGRARREGLLAHQAADHGAPNPRATEPGLGPVGDDR